MVGGILESVLLEKDVNKKQQEQNILNGMCENTNNSEMSSLPRTKYQEKQLQWQLQTEI